MENVQTENNNHLKYANTLIRYINDIGDIIDICMYLDYQEEEDLSTYFSCRYDLLNSIMYGSDLTNDKLLNFLSEKGYEDQVKHIKLLHSLYLQFKDYTYFTNLYRFMSKGFKSKERLEENNECCCYACGAQFEFKSINKWSDKGLTALCTVCHIDSVVPLIDVKSITTTTVEETLRSLSFLGFYRSSPFFKP